MAFLKKTNNNLLNPNTMKHLQELIRSGQATVIDVRTPGEFIGGHVSGSLNIPLTEIPERIDELKQHRNIILCCASGNRSGQAAAWLKQHGVACENGGSWLDVNAYA